MGICLAFYAYYREERQPAWVNYLAKNIQSYFKKSRDFIYANQDKCSGKNIKSVTNKYFGESSIYLRDTQFMEIKSYSIFIFIMFTSVLNSFAQDGWISGAPKLAYWTIGNNSDNIVIVLHGGPTAAHNYLRPEWDDLSDIAKVIYYDQRGCGKSEKADCYTWLSNVQDLKRLITNLCPSKKVVLAGSSWGTTLALLYNYTYPNDVKALILSGTYLWQGTGVVNRSCSFYKPKKPIKDIVYHFSLKYGILVPSPADFDDKIRDSVVKDWRLFESHPFSVAFILNSSKESPALDALKRIATPTLIFEGKGKCDSRNPILQSVKDGAFQFKGILQNLKVYPIDACHDPWYTNSKEFFSQTKDFIRQLN